MGKNITIGNTPVYRAEPKGTCKGGLIVIHEVWGLVDHIRSVADRFAEEGYLVISPDLLYETDISSMATDDMQQALFDPERRTAVQPQLRTLMAPLQAPDFGEKTLAALKEIFTYLFDDPLTKQNVAVTGFCFGGSYSYVLAAAEPRLKAAVPFYGQADLSDEQIAGITAPILAFYGEQDDRLVSALPELKDKMAAAHKSFEPVVYDHAGHAFFNDSNPFAYVASAADDAWDKTISFLAQHINE